MSLCVTFFHFKRQTVIKCHLARLMGERKMSVSDVARETGLHRNTVTLLYKETAKQVDIETIDKLCELFDCQVADLFERYRED